MHASYAQCNKPPFSFELHKSLFLFCNFLVVFSQHFLCVSCLIRVFFCFLCVLRAPLGSSDLLFTKLHFYHQYYRITSYNCWAAVVGTNGKYEHILSLESWRKTEEHQTQQSSHAVTEVEEPKRSHAILTNCTVRKWI